MTFPIGIIYKIFSENINKVYVGQTKNSLKFRFQGHLSDARGGNPNYLYNSMRKYGINTFNIESLEILKNCTREDLNAREKFWISKYNSTDPAKGYNLTSGGDANDAWEFMSEEKKKQISDLRKKWRWSEEQKEKRKQQTKKIWESLSKQEYEERCKNISESQKGRVGNRKKISEANKGKTTRKVYCLSEEHKKKIGLANKGRIMSEEQKRKISETKKAAVKKSSL
jgi:group I intron endonuclease